MEVGLHPTVHALLSLGQKQQYESEGFRTGGGGGGGGGGATTGGTGAGGAEAGAGAGGGPPEGVIATSAQFQNCSGLVPAEATSGRGFGHAPRDGLYHPVGNG